MKSRTLATGLILLLLAGCAITQSIKPVARFQGNQVCIVENPAVSQAGFLVAYKRALTDKGYQVRQLSSDAAITACPITSTYTANWRWDLAMYMAFADIKVYTGGVQSGHATYDAKSGGANMNKFIKGEAKILELVDQLFPRAGP
jgi:hypothetical protein